MHADKRMGRGPRLRIRPKVEALEGRDLLSSGGGRTAHASLSASWVAVVKGKAGASLGSYAGAMPRSGLVSAAGADDDTARTSHGRPTFVAGPLVTVSDPSLTPPVRDQGPLGTLYVGSSVEPQLAVDPRAPRHLVAVWQQDRWSNEGARAIDSSVSFDGGVTWSKPAVVPGLVLGSRGPYARISDPWVAFSRDGSTVYISALPFATLTNIDGQWSRARARPGPQDALPAARRGQGLAPRGAVHEGPRRMTPVPGTGAGPSSTSTPTGTAPGSSRNSRNSRDLGPPVREAPAPAAGPAPSRTRAGGRLLGPSALQPPAEAGPTSRPDLTFRRGGSPDRQGAATQPANRDAGRLPAIEWPLMSPNVSSSWNGSSRRPSLVHNASSSR